MPNWVDNTLTILVPAGRLEALKADIAGPADWPFPLEALGMELRVPDLSNHQKLALGEDAAARIAAFRRHPERAGHYPEWMPVSRTDIVAMEHTPEALDIARVPFSVPRLLPFAGRDEFDHLFPGETDGLYWSTSNGDRSYSRGAAGLIALRHAKIGTKWPPSGVVIVDELDPAATGSGPADAAAPADTGADTAGKDWASIVIEFRPPWNPMSNVAEMLEPVLEAHGGKALIVWEEEDLHSGFDYVNPATGLVLSQDFGREMTCEVHDKDYPDEEFHEIDPERLRDAVTCRIDDPDF